METLQHKIAYAPDEDLVEKIVQGETALFEVLVRRYNSLLYKIARSYGFTHPDCEDLMQESHVAAFFALRSFRREASYKTWLTKIHLHRCYHKLKAGLLHCEELRDELFTNPSVFMQKPTENVDTAKKVLSRELGRVVEKSLQRLPLPYRTVFMLREIEGFSVAETAELLGLTATNVKVRLNRAKAMLQKQLEKFYSVADLYEFNLVYCDKIVRNVFERIASANGSQ